MAGIGFDLRKLAEHDTLIDPARAFFSAAIISAGPWLCTVLALWLIAFWGQEITSLETLRDFRIVVMYNFSFSLALTGGLCLVSTRMLADAIYQNDLNSASGLIVGSLALMYLVLGPIALYCYLGLYDLDTSFALLSTINFLLVSSIWVIVVFVSMIREYNSITISFLVSLGLSVVFSLLLVERYQATGLLLGFNIGLAVLFFWLFGKVNVLFPPGIRRPFGILSAFKKYWQLALGGLIFNSAIWVDKWIMWLSPMSERLEAGFLHFPNYDSAMFLSHLTIVPSLALFLYSVETEFFGKFRKFYYDVNRLADFRKINQNHQELKRCLFACLTRLVKVQLVLSSLIVVMAPEIFRLFQISFIQLGVFRFGCAGSACLVILMIISVFLGYLEARKEVLLIYGTFFILSMFLTIFTVFLGFKYYGLGFFLATAISLTIAIYLLEKFVSDLPYHAFISTNSAINEKSTSSSTS